MLQKLICAIRKTFFLLDGKPHLHCFLYLMIQPDEKLADQVHGCMMDILQSQCIAAVLVQ
jgi:hypothetical protein